MARALAGEAEFQRAADHALPRDLGVHARRSTRPRRSSPTIPAARASSCCRSTGRPRPRGYLGWGKSHQLGTGLGLAIGAKVAAPDKFCVNFMGDAAFGMTGLDFETAVRCGIPI